MVAANPERTSWTAEEVAGNLNVEWYRPIEAYIPPNFQIIAANGLLYISTARGLYALNASNGEIAWRFDTEMPLGNSPTVANGVVYVGGYDRKIHALDALTGAHLWEFTGAQAGFDTNPLVVNGKVIAGNRDGYLYAIGAHGSPEQGQLVWKFQTGGPIHLSAAYKDETVYFASNDNRAYAVDVNSGDLKWKSEVLPGDGYHSYWPVIYQDVVIFSAASGYRAGVDPGTASVLDPSGNPYGKIYDMERDDLFPGDPENTLIGPEAASQDWAHGYPVVDVSRLTEYLESNPDGDSHKHKPWRRVFIALNLQDGKEYTFDSDQDGYPEYMPVAMWGTHSGNRYPPIVGPDDVVYQSNIYQNKNIPQGLVMGWKLGSKVMSITRGQGAVDEPQAISAGGNVIYRSVCCDRVGDWFSLVNPTARGTLWSYSMPLFTIAPGYDEKWFYFDPDDTGRFLGNYGNINGIYHSHGDQNPFIPYGGRLYIHRSNAIIAFGPGQPLGKLPLLAASNTPIYQGSSVPLSSLKTKLEAEIKRMIAAGHLRPAYYNSGQFATRYSNLGDYFDNPGDTIVTLARALPYLTPSVQEQVKDYLAAEFRAYFEEEMYARTGWSEGAPRESMPLPPEVASAALKIGKSKSVGIRWSWQYPQHNLYAMWKYAQVFPSKALRVYELAKSKVEAPVPDKATDDYLAQKPYEHNAYIAGYLGFLELQAMVGMSGQDSALRTTVTNELNRLLQLRSNQFSKDTYWKEVDFGSYHFRVLNVARNFMFLAPELGDYLNKSALTKVHEAVAEYNTVAPYWFVSRFNAVANEGVMQNLYDPNAMLHAKVYILKQSRAEATKYLDVPAFYRGDLLYIQNLIALIEAP